MKTGVLNYNAGNLTSVESALRYIGCDYFVSDDPEQLLTADRLIFPGVGDAGFAMNNLCSSGMDHMLRDFVKTGRPLMGICLGAQILFGGTQERETECLGLIPGRVTRFNPDMGLKVPHMGWNHVKIIGQPKLFKGIPDETSFYFVHSFFIEPEDSSVVAGETDYGIPFCSAVEYQNITAAQFHPEKSGEYGLQMLRNFLQLN